MVDRVYRSDLPRLRTSLVELRSELARLDTATDWVHLRVDPLLKHAERLETLLRTWESSPLRGAVPMLHSDLVYLRENVHRLGRVLAAQKRPSHRPRRSR